MIPTVAYLLILIELATVAWIDLKFKKISNKWIAFNLLTAILCYLVWRDAYEVTWQILIFPAGFIVIGFLLFLIDVMGAGDSKFLASLFLMIPLGIHSLFFEKLIFSTVITGFVLLVFRIIRDRVKLKAFVLSGYWKGILESIRSRFSYAPVILLAWLVMGVDLWN